MFPLFTAGWTQLTSLAGYGARTQFVLATFERRYPWSKPEMLVIGGIPSGAFELLNDVWSSKDGGGEYLRMWLIECRLTT